MKAYSQDFRLKIVETQKKTLETIQQTADRFGVSYSFVKRLLKRYQAQGSVEPKPHGGGATPKLTSEQINLVVKLVEEDNDATLKQLGDRLEEKTATRVSVPTLCRLLQKLELTRKKKSLHADEAETERVQNLRREYWTIIREVNLLDLIFIDETGVNLAMTPRDGRAKKGRRAYNKCPYNRGRNISLIGAISHAKFLASLTFEGWTDKNAFFTYVQKILVPQLWSGACVIMDNLPAHKATQVREERSD